ncbi:queuosine precursor transporter [Candidatus Dependentiae bacterium]|nr:queuosine precursor transporter [Candidatus Dependentiae bacterium]
MNELLFTVYILTVASANLIALALGKEALIGLVCVQAILVNLFVVKQITLLGFTATASDGLAVGITLSLNLLQEYYTKSAAQRALYISFLGCLFYVFTAYLTMAYTPSATDTMSSHLTALLVPTPRLIAASLSTYGIVQYLDVLLYGLLKRTFNHRFFMLRNYCSLMITQLMDTVLFSFLGLYGIHESFTSLHTLFSIIITSYAIKLMVIALAVPFITVARTFKRYTHS